MMNIKKKSNLKYRSIRLPFTEYLLQYSQLQQTQLMSVIDAFSVVSVLSFGLHYDPDSFLTPL